ncbi:MAG: hypothetical protein P8J87_07815 [Verrucomicrobiales bacterium]|nr:hypothetical protein [Verrucomicrobiales bacterium]
MQLMTANGFTCLEEKGLEGSSLDRGYQNQIWRKLVLVMVVPLLMVQLAIYEWMKAIFWGGSFPVGLTLMAALAAGYAAFRVRPLERRLAASVGSVTSAGWWRLEEILTGFGKSGVQILRNFPITGGEVVPVLLIGKTGIFAIWVDHSRMESSQFCEVLQRVEGERETVLVNGFEAFGDPLGLAVSGATQVRSLIQRGSNPDCYVVPVLVIPRSRMVEPPVGATVVVVDETGLKRLVEGEGSLLDETSVKAIGSALVLSKEQSERKV